MANKNFDECTVQAQNKILKTIEEPPQNTYFDINRYQNEINELKRMNSEMLKRIARIENYLGLRKDNENIY